MAGYFPHGFGGCSLCGRSGEMGALIDTMGIPQIRNRMGSTLEQVEKQIKDTAARTVQKVPIKAPDTKAIKMVLDRSRNTVKAGVDVLQQEVEQRAEKIVGAGAAAASGVIESSVSKGIYSGAEQVQTSMKPYLIGGGLLLGAAVLYFMMKR